jgi:hypothetical protein
MEIRREIKQSITGEKWEEEIKEKVARKDQSDYDTKLY